MSYSSLELLEQCQQVQPTDWNILTRNDEFLQKLL